MNRPASTGSNAGWLAVALGMVVLGGCATFSRDGGFGAVEMPLPENTLPMMGGQGPFGPMEMGGMFTVIKIREGLARDDYRDPGWYKHPKGTVAYEWKEKLPAS